MVNPKELLLAAAKGLTELAEKVEKGDVIVHPDSNVSVTFHPVPDVIHQDGGTEYREDATLKVEIRYTSKSGYQIKFA